MDKTNISQQLAKASGANSRSVRARISDVLDDIEKAISSGVAHDEIVAILNKNGFDLSIKSFRNALYLARKKAAGKTVIRKPAPVQPTAEKQAKPQKDSSKEADEIDLKALGKLGSKTKRNRL
ncbi:MULTISPECIES: hypothetical protein [Methylophaga]|uniref:hypothetical protein n=1 Tax=Methylophaga TaxID=40222 RepID=UPI000CDC17FF|nr:hypothetical protein [Methylophaga nitratireducenticrescens]AUZ86127.1 hypothetical protein CDW43_15865 [Methylophaga nitratireducenticrescens]